MSGCTGNRRGETVEYRRPQDYMDLKFIEGVQYHQGGAVFYWYPPRPPQLPSTTSITGRGERSLRRQGIWLDRVKSGQSVIGGAIEGRRPVNVHCR